MQDHDQDSAQEHEDGVHINLDFLRQLMFFSMLNHLGGGPHIRFVVVKNCEDSSLPMPLAKEHVRCFICERLFDDAERIAVLPCGDVLCRHCADRAISAFRECPICNHETHGYRTRPFFFMAQNHRDNKLEMPLLKGAGCCAICLKDFEDCGDIAILPCGHPFCCACIDHALTIKEICPVCRKVAKGYRVRKFFK